MFSEKGMKTVPEKDTRNTRNTSFRKKKNLTKFSRIDQLHEKIYTRL